MRRFPAYKLSDLLDEECELLRLVQVEAYGKPEQGSSEPAEGGEWGQ